MESALIYIHDQDSHGGAEAWSLHLTQYALPVQLVSEDDSMCMCTSAMYNDLARTLPEPVWSK